MKAREVKHTHTRWFLLNYEVSLYVVWGQNHQPNLVAKWAVVAVGIPRRRAHSTLWEMAVKGQLVHQVHVVKPHCNVGGVFSGRVGEGEVVVAESGGVLWPVGEEV